jgi:molybdate transport system permease protein
MKLTWKEFVAVLFREETLWSVKLSLVTSTITTFLAVILGVPAAYALSRFRLPGALFLDTILDLPIVLPPAIMGISLLILFYMPYGKWLEARGLEFAFTRRGVVLAQFVIAAPFCVRALKAAFDNIDPRLEGVARTLGCSRFRAFWKVTLPLAKSGLIAGAIMTWARAIGEFGPILFFVGTEPTKGGVMPIRIYLDMSTGQIESAITMVLIMLAIGTFALLLFKKLGGRGYLW